MKKVMKLFRQYSDDKDIDRYQYRLRLFSDWSGYILDNNDEEVTDFSSKKELIDYLKKAIDK